MTKPLASSTVAVLFATVLVAGSGAAQLISPKTIPVAEGDQFLLYPSLRMGMGGISIAIDDPLGDPFVNPARGAALSGSVLFAAPTHYNVTDGDGNGITLPVGGLWTGTDWFGSVAVALQQISAPQRPWLFSGWWCCTPQPETLSDRAASNLYGALSLGRRLADGRTAVAVSASYAALDAVDGVDLLYAMSEKIEQNGHIADVRVGLTRELDDGGSLEVLALHDRFRMTHEVTYLDWQWDTTSVQPIVTRRDERNLDHTDTWGLHVGYDRPIGGAGWRAGGVVTGNYKNHPKIPNYEIMNIARDPGHSWAYNIGAGVAQENGPLAVGLDVILEPIWSSTWADAAEPVQTASGGTIPVGGRTVENEFVFRNAIIRTGVGRETERYGAQLGLRARAISYRLDQRDNIAETDRRQRESWVEWTPTWSAALKFPEVDIRYSGRLTTGTGHPGTGWDGPVLESVRLASTFIPAPSGPLTLQDATVITHRIMASIPVH